MSDSFGLKSWFAAVHETGAAREFEMSVTADRPEEAAGATVTSGGAPGRCSLREIGAEAVWSLSTAKPGNGVEQIRDDNVDTYWQSDGGQPPHQRPVPQEDVDRRDRLLPRLQPRRELHAQEALGASRRAPARARAVVSSAPLPPSRARPDTAARGAARAQVRAGTTFHDLVEVQAVELNEPMGWVTVPLAAPPDADGGALDDALEGAAPLLRAHFLQICIVSMHQNGRDTHIRQAKVYGPRRSLPGSLSQTAAGVPEFTTIGFTQFSVLR